MQASRMFAYMQRRDAVRRQRRLCLGLVLPHLGRLRPGGGVGQPGSVRSPRVRTVLHGRNAVWRGGRLPLRPLRQQPVRASEPGPGVRRRHRLCVGGVLRHGRRLRVGRRPRQRGAVRACGVCTVLRRRDWMREQRRLRLDAVQPACVPAAWLLRSLQPGGPVWRRRRLRLACVLRDDWRMHRGFADGRRGHVRPSCMCSRLREQLPVQQQR